MKEIRKKILPCYFDDVKARKKNFEIWKDKDNIQVGDTLILCEWDRTHLQAENYQEKLSMYCEMFRSMGYKTDFVLLVGN